MALFKSWAERTESERYEVESILTKNNRSNRTFTVYSDENRKDTIRLAVANQIKYTGTRRVIPSSLSDVPCAELGAAGMLRELNEVMETVYTLETPGLRDLLLSHIAHGEDFGYVYGILRQRWDESAFPTLQEQLRCFGEGDKGMREDALTEDKQHIRNVVLAPRRVWDLYSHRVLPWWAAGMDAGTNPDMLRRQECWQWPVGVSHAWMDSASLKYVWTPVNKREWPVPVPCHSTESSDSTNSCDPPAYILERVRVELLNLLDGYPYFSGYVWLDILCLRQHTNHQHGTSNHQHGTINWSCWRYKSLQFLRSVFPNLPWSGVQVKDSTVKEEREVKASCTGDEDGMKPDGQLLSDSENIESSEMRRLDEWKTDIPTIGAVYQEASGVVVYFSGLGRPFEIGHLDSERHWLNRAWTLQEVPQYDDDLIVAGMPARNAVPFAKRLLSAKDDDFSPEENKLEPFRKKLNDMRNARCSGSVLELVEVMKPRHATNERDRISGLAYLVGCLQLPVYHPTFSLENATNELISSIDKTDRLQQLLLYPEPDFKGNGGQLRSLWELGRDQVGRLPAVSIPGKFKYNSFWTVPLQDQILQDSRNANSLDPPLPAGIFLVRGLYLLRHCNIACLGRPAIILGASSPTPSRIGQLTVLPESPGTYDPASYSFNVTVTHSHPIYDGYYTLAGCPDSTSWPYGTPHPVFDWSESTCFAAVVGRLTALDPPRFKKVSVLHIELGGRGRPHTKAKEDLIRLCGKFEPQTVGFI